MSSRPRRIYWDTNLFLYHLNASNTKGYLPGIEHVLAQAQAGEVQIFTSTITAAETAFIDLDFSSDPRFGHEAEIDALWDMHPAIIPVPLTLEIARDARGIKRWQMQQAGAVPKLEWIDLLHLATAVFSQAVEIHTAESDWDAYAAYTGIPILRPPAPPNQLTLNF